MPKIYLAPLQGLTDWMFREAFTESIAAFDKTFTPFVRVQNGEFYRPNQCHDLLPEHNRMQIPVPQFLGNAAQSFLRFESLCREHGYEEVNINMGCPYPMVTGRRMGAGFLSHPAEVARFFEDIFRETTVRISVKCRLGMLSETEFADLIPVFNAYPLEEIILHPRIGKQQYKGDVDLDSFVKYAPLLKAPVCYNGDIQTDVDIPQLQQLLPGIDVFMIGRGVLTNPFLLSDIRQEKLSATDKTDRLKKFHTVLLEKCVQKYSGDHHFLKHLEELWSYQSSFFDNGQKLFKQIKKCKTLGQYRDVVFPAIDAWRRIRN